MNKMSFVDHLEELRACLLKSCFFVLFFSIIGYLYSDLIIDFLINPLKDDSTNLQVIKLTSIFMVKIGVSIIFGIIISFPFVFYQLLKFILPAFENKLTNFKIFFISLFSMLLFILGLFFGYKILIPYSISFFTNLANDLSFISLNYTLENYLFYLIWVLIISSMIFQFPLLTIILVKIGIVSTKILSNKRKYIIVFIFIFSAILTPPDPFSQLLVVLPTYVLFELSIFLSKFIK